jgi:asparagine synthase (glutamine-hydrolysing)
MCGLTGFLALGGDRSRESLGPTIERMTETLRHRGPDDGSTWSDPEVTIALGHRRLAILDVSANGRQPMHSACRRYVIVFNGEIYNFPALRADLEEGGHQFRGTSDTEVMLAGIATWGVERAVQRFNGMFAFALWDRTARRLWLGRDRLGIKPLYYGWFGETLLFGSELKALRGHPAFVADVDRQALALYLRHNYVPVPHSIYRGVSKLPPGTLLHIDAARAERSAPRAYWSAADVLRRGLEDPFTGSDADAIAALEDLLRDAVRLQMVADVPLGVFLSGGVDSSLVAALMQSQSSGAIRTFTIGFREPAYDEARHARAVADHLGTKHEELYVEPEHALSVVPNLPEWFDEPFADQSELPTYLMAQMTRRHVVVALSGDGGDELFLGYERYQRAAALRRMFAWMPPAARRTFAAWIRALPFPAGGDGRVGTMAAVMEGEEAIYRRLTSHWHDPQSVVIGGSETVGGTGDGFADPALPSVFERMQLLDLITYLPEDVLTKLDRASMAVGLEARVPFLDHRLVEFAARIPLSLKLRRQKTKWILRRVLERYLPREIVDRPKMGFTVPIEAWLRGPLREWAEELLSESRLRRGGFFRPEAIRTKWAQHLNGRGQWQNLLWDVLMFEAWRDRWLA